MFQWVKLAIFYLFCLTGHFKYLIKYIIFGFQWNLNAFLALKEYLYWLNVSFYVMLYVICYVLCSMLCYVVCSMLCCMFYVMLYVLFYFVFSILCSFFYDMLYGLCYVLCSMLCYVVCSILCSISYICHMLPHNYCDHQCPQSWGPDGIGNL